MPQRNQATTKGQVVCYLFIKTNFQMVQDHHIVQAASINYCSLFYCPYPLVSFHHHSLVCVTLPCFSLCPSIIYYFRYELCLSIRFPEAFGAKIVNKKMAIIDHQIRIKLSLRPETQQSNQYVGIHIMFLKLLRNEVAMLLTKICNFS